MTYLECLDAYSKLLRSRLYAQLMGTFLAFLLVVAGVLLVFATSMMTRDPASGGIFFDPSWLGSWIFAASVAFLLYSLMIFVVLVVALRRYFSHRADHRPFLLAAYMMLPIFPAGTFFSIYAIYKMNAVTKAGEQAGHGGAEQAV